MQIVIDVPERYLLDESAESAARRFKLYVAMMLFRSGKISAGAACELAAVDRYSFLAACKEHDVPAISYPAEELEAEAEWLTHRGSTSS
jgi:predicted HTH domain antitoxin